MGLLTATLLLSGGCATRQKFSRNELTAEEKQTLAAEKPAELQKYYIDLHEEGDRNAVLNYMRLGKEAYVLGQLDVAQEAFRQATAGIEQVYGYDQQSADIRSLWIEEGAKIFKGEPYERAMAFFYQGLTFIDQGDYENARASFVSGELQDAFAEDDQHRCDFALLYYLDGWCSFVLKDTELANQSFASVTALRPAAVLPKPGDNLLIMVETGTSPRKVADGPGHSELKFRRGRNFSEKTVEISFDGESYQSIVPIEDIYYQAATRGGREVDKIVEGKAQFRSGTTQAGDVLADIGNTAVVISPLLDSSSNLGAIGGAIGLVGVTSMAIGQSTRPHADTRYWDSLPDSYHLLSATLLPGIYTITIRYLGSDKKFLKEIRKQISIPGDNAEPKVVWFGPPSQT